MRRAPLLAIALALGAVAGCDGGSPSLRMRVVPGSADVVPDGTLQLEARVSGTLRDDVSWDVIEGPGTITSDGTFTAPGYIPFGGANAIRVRATSLVDGDSFAEAQLRVVRPPLSPPFGPSAGGTLVTLDGAGFGPSTRVFVDGDEVAITVVSAFELTFTTPPHPIGAVPIRIEGAGSAVLDWPHAFRFAATSSGFAESAALRPCDLAFLRGAADFTGDGTADAAFDCGTHTAIVMFDAGGNPAAEPLRIFGQDLSGTVRMADLDRDGASELVGFTGDATRVLRWNGSAFAVATDGPGMGVEAVIADFTAGPELDIVALDGLVTLWEVGPDLGLTMRGSRSVPGAVSLAAGPLDSEPHDDLVVTRASGFAVFVSSNGGFAAPSSYATAQTPEVAVGELGGNGDRNLVAISGADVLVYVADAAGALSLDVTIPLTAPKGLLVADVDGSGAGDLSLVEAGQIEIYRDPAGPVDVVPVEIAALPGELDYAFANLDGDALPDLVVAGTTGPGPGKYFMSYTRVLAGRGAGAFGADASNADGVLAQARADGADVVAIVGGDLSATSLARLGGDSVVVPFARTLELADLDRDGVAEAILSAGETVEVHPGPAPSAPAIAIAATGTVIDAVPADLDGDGAVDLALSIAGTNGGLAIAWSVPDAGLAFDPPEIVAPVFALDLDAGDVDGDGFVDLVSIASSAGTVSIVPGAAGRTVDASGAREYFSGAPASQLELADIDGDGLPEILLVAQESFEVLPSVSLPHVTVVVLGNLGAFQLEERFRYSIPGVLGGHCAITEIDGDGIPDLAIARGMVGSIVLYHGTPEGRLRLGDGVVAGESPTAFAFPDVDGDGLLDVVAGDKDGVVRTLHNRSR